MLQNLALLQGKIKLVYQPNLHICKEEFINILKWMKGQCLKDWMERPVCVCMHYVCMWQCMYVCCCCCCCCWQWQWQDGLKVSASNAIQLHPRAEWMLTDCHVFPQISKWRIGTRSKQTLQTAAGFSCHSEKLQQASFYTQNVFHILASTGLSCHINYNWNMMR